MEQVESIGEYGPRYTIVYRADRELLALILGLGYGALGNMPGPPTVEPITVHGQQGSILITPTEKPESNDFIGVSWQEEGRIYQIKAWSRRVTRDELLQIVMSLEPVR
ncbi:MAG: hypothetical protein ACYC5J_15190 [Chloroflexota bacterium]